MSRQRAKAAPSRPAYPAAVPEIPLRLEERSPATAHAAMLEALLAGEGLRRVAEIAAHHAGAEVGIFVPRPGSEGSAGSPAERYVAELVGGGDPLRPAEVSEVVPVLAAGSLQGAVLMFGAGAPDALGYLEAAALATLTGIAMLNARDDLSHAAGAGPLARLLDGEIGAGQLLRQARAAGSELGEGALAVCAEPADGRPSALLATVLGERPDALAEVLGERLYALLPGGAPAAAGVLRRLRQRAAVGSSSFSQGVGDPRLALREAALLLDLGAADGPGAARAGAASYRLLLRAAAADPELAGRFLAETIGPLLRQDREGGTELARTLAAYIDCNCNMNLTAKATYTHRHTVANRLARIRELCGLDPAESEDRELLGLALKAQRLAAAGFIPRSP